MKNLKMTKRIVLIALFLFVNVFISRASVTLSGLSVNPEYLVSGRLNVTNPSVPTTFKFQVMVGRPLVAGTTSYQDGTCEATLVYMLSPNSSGSNSVAVSSPIQISNSSYSGAYANVGNLSATLPANIRSGAVMIKLTYYDTDQKKTLTIYIPQHVVNIQYTPTRSDIFDLVSYPARRAGDNVPYYNIESNPLGIKLPGGNLEVRWNSTQLNSGSVNIYLYQETNSVTGPTLITQRTAQNTGNYVFDFSALSVGFYNYKYYILIEDPSNLKTGRTAIFRFVNDHASLFDFPNAFPNAYWIFRPDSSGSYNDLSADWFPALISASNVSIDLYDSEGVFYKRLVESTPNNGHFSYPDPGSIPRGNPYFYQFRITSVENPSQFGYSEVFHFWYD